MSYKGCFGNLFFCSTIRYHVAMSDLSLEPIVRQYVNMNPVPSAKGWHSCKCAVCNDYKTRGGFKFDGDTTVYQCFNCAHVAKHDPSEYISISEKMQTVLNAFGIAEDDYKHIYLAALKNKGKGSAPVVETDPDTKLVKIEMPEHFIHLDQAEDKWAEVARAYLEIDRGVDPESHPFLILDAKKQHEKIEKKWRGRLIIPYYRNNQLIWYQGRDLRPESKSRWLNAETTSECILSNFDALNKHTDEPLIIAEGFFDTHILDGVAIFRNKMTEGQIKMLNKSRRRKIYVPDKRGQGYIGANQAIQNGWEVSIPDYGSAKDISEAYSRYGKLYVLNSILKEARKGAVAKMLVGTHCR